MYLYVSLSLSHCKLPHKVRAKASARSKAALTLERTAANKTNDCSRGLLKLGEGFRVSGLGFKNPPRLKTLMLPLLLDYTCQVC